MNYDNQAFLFLELDKLPQGYINKIRKPLLPQVRFSLYYYNLEEQNERKERLIRNKTGWTVMDYAEMFSMIGTGEQKL